MENIHTEIYNQPDIQKRLRPLTWAWICGGIGIVCGYLLYTLQGISSGMNALLVGMIAIGGFAIVTIICYYTFGDSRAPFHTPTRKMLSAEQQFYPATAREQVVDAVVNHDKEKLAHIKPGSAPEIIVVRYSDDSERIVYTQVLDNTVNKATPLTEIVKD